jgi:hypothetical protein
MYLKINSKLTSTPAAGYPNAAHCSIQTVAELFVGNSSIHGKIRAFSASLQKPIDHHIFSALTGKELTASSQRRRSFQASPPFAEWEQGIP